MKAEIRPVFTYEQAPLMVYWEMTQACDLACRHCRASAVSKRDPQELSMGEAQRLLEQINSFGKPTLILTGGDPMKRLDLFDLISYARSLGLPVGITPSGTQSLPEEAITHLKASGIQIIALSLDGSDVERHDRFRQVDGCFAQTTKAARYAKQSDLHLQINTTVTEETLDDLPKIASVVAELNAVRWSVFFLVPIGRGKLLRQISSAACERVLNWLCGLSSNAPFQIKTTEAHHYRRVQLQRSLASGRSLDEILKDPASRGFGIRDGAGVIFISHRGDVYPSGFLPLSAGNIRRRNLTDLYRESSLFRGLRDPNQLKGKCGRCEFRWVCGGSRARAYAVTGDYLQADPLCVYQPRGN